MRVMIQEDGHAYIAVDAVMEILAAMIATRDQAIAQTGEGKILVPGSDAAAAFLAKVLKDVRYEFFDQENLDEESGKLINEIYGYLYGL